MDENHYVHKAYKKLFCHLYYHLNLVKYYLFNQLVPRPQLQHISGDNWSSLPWSPEWSCDYVTYCRLKNPPTNAIIMVSALGATLHTESVCVDDNRLSGIFLFPYDHT